MNDQINKMNKLDFFLGKWKMECNVPESAFSKADKGTGIGEFKKELDDKYVVFNYTLEEQARRKTIPEEAVSMLKSLAKVGFNILFCGEKAN